MQRKVVVVVPPSRSDSRLCWRCGTPLSDRGPCCRQCGAIQDLADGMTHFEVLGIAPLLKLDSEALRERFYQLSRQTHPDKFGNAAPPEPTYALRWSTAINRAYQTLRDPLERSSYLLESQNFPLAKNPQVPLELAEAYFDLQDLLSEPQGETKMAEFRERLGGQLKQSESEWQMIANYWDAASDDAARQRALERLHQYLTKQRYLRSMIADLDRKGADHGHSGD